MSVATPLSLRPPELRRVGVVAAGLMALAALATTVVATTLLHPSDDQPMSALSSDAERATPRTLAAEAAPVPHSALPESTPTRVAIPALGVDATVVGLGRTPSGVAEVPGHASAVGWLADGPTPGETGTSVLTGHTDFAHERGSFFSLHLLRPGDTVRVARADRSIGAFTVYRVEELAPKYALAHATAPSNHPELRLLTAANSNDGGGATLVVSARLTAAVEGE
ncbi:peptidase C60, sortase A and B [Saccharomonospora azurea SZMC 14600]|nr:peptidase C60, sortase A and B [Saccharomonospora azurea SZMC 14600]